VCKNSLSGSSNDEGLLQKVSAGFHFFIALYFVTESEGALYIAGFHLFALLAYITVIFLVVKFAWEKKPLLLWLPLYLLLLLLHRYKLLLKSLLNT
jgi:hypothetical protein